MASALRPLVRGCFVLLCASIWFVSAKAEETRQVAVAINDQSLRQKEIQIETERTARGINSVLRMLSYHNVDKATENKLLKDTADTLSKLSRDDMAGVLKLLDAAVKAPDDKTSDDQQRKAYAKHREIVDQLKLLLLKYDLISTLDLAAERMEKAAKAQNELRITSTAGQVQLQAGGRGFQPRRFVVDNFQEEADSQFDLNRDIENIFVQLAVLEKRLNPEQQDRLRKADAHVRGRKIGETARQSHNFLKQNNANLAAPNQEKVARELLELAFALRTPRDPLEVLREARTRLDKTIQEHEDVKTATAQMPENRKIQNAAARRK